MAKQNGESSCHPLPLDSVAFCLSLSPKQKKGKPRRARLWLPKAIPLHPPWAQRQRSERGNRQLGFSGCTGKVNEISNKADLSWLKFTPAEHCPPHRCPVRQRRGPFRTELPRGASSTPPLSSPPVVRSGITWNHQSAVGIEQITQILPGWMERLSGPPCLIFVYVYVCKPSARKTRRRSFVESQVVVGHRCGVPRPEPYSSAKTDTQLWNLPCSALLSSGSLHRQHDLRANISRLN